MNAPGTDARWVFASVVASRLEGGRAAVLRPEKRERLLAMAPALGIRPFDAALIIAMVQDAARRGEAPGQAGASTRALAERLAGLPEPGKRAAAGADESRPDILGLAAAAFMLATALVGMAILWVQMGGR